jgi:PAS domain S-box-containing protein
MKDGNKTRPLRRQKSATLPQEIVARKASEKERGKKTEEARRRSEEEAKRVALENATMAEIGRILSSTLNIQEVYESFAEAVRKLIPFDRISITAIDPQRRTFMISYTAGLGASGRKEGDVIALAGTAAEEVIQTHASMLIGNLEKSAGRFPGLLPLLEAGFQTMMLVPLISRDRVIGILNLESAKPPIYTEQDLKLAENVGNQIAGAIANAQLFAERDHVLETLREREERFRSILETMEEGYFEVDLKGRFTFFNDSLRKMMGFSKDELMGMSNREYMDEKTARRIYGIFNQIYKTGQPGKVFEWGITRRDGTSSLHESSVYLIRNAKGERIGFRGLIREVTERKNMEEALRRSEKAAQQLARENAIIAEIGRIFCSTLNIEDVYERFAEEVRKLIPFDRIEINAKKFGEDTVIGIHRAGLEVPERQVGKSFSLAGTITGEVLRTSSSLLISADPPEDSLKRFPGYLPAYQAGLRSLMAVPLISRDEPIGVLAISSLQRNAYTEDALRLAEKVGTQIAGAVANAQLYAGLKRAEEDLRHTQAILEMRVNERTEDLVKARDAAESANRAKSEFLANMSHELRTPLNHILGFTELVVDKQCGELNEEQGEYLNDVLQSSRHLLSLINDILDLSKVEAGKLELQVKEIHLRTLLEGSLGMVKEKAMKHGIRLLTDIDGIPREVQADERKLKQIIYNLLSNAVKFTPDGGSVTLSARHLPFWDGEWYTRDGEAVEMALDGNDRLRMGAVIEISVQDTGVGIRHEDLERIFDPFEQGDNSASRRYQGTGLGLSLSRKLVELHGGRIWAASEGEGKGSKFTFVIPF